MANVIGMIGIVVGATLIGIILYVIYKVKTFSREAFGTTDLAAGLKHQKEILEDTPKSVSSMTKIELPRIKEDFPEFHWPEWKQRCENQLKGYLEALEHQNISYLKDASAPLKEQLQLKISDEQGRGLRETFDCIVIHRTEIMRYEKGAGMCRI